MQTPVETETVHALTIGRKDKTNSIATNHESLITNHFLQLFFATPQATCHLKSY